MRHNKLISLILLLFAFDVLAQTAPEVVPYQGRLTDPTGVPINYQVDVKFRIYPPVGGCYIYEDSHVGAVNGITPNTYGVFTALLGMPGNSTGPANSFGAIFSNDPTPAVPITDSCAGTYTPAANDWRRIEIIVNGVPMVDMQTVGSSPFALQANNTVYFDGKLSNQYLQTTLSLTQNAAEDLVSATDIGATYHNHDSLYARTDGGNSFTGDVATTANIYTTGGSVGVGDSTPDADIEIEKAAPTMRFTATGAATIPKLDFYGGATQRASIQSSANTNELKFYTGNSLAMTLDGSQNVLMAGSLTVAGTTIAGKYTNAQETAILLPVLTASGVGAIGTQWSNTNGSLRYWDGAAMRTVANTDMVIGAAGNSPGFSSAAGIVTLNIPLASSAATVTSGTISNAEYLRIPGAGTGNNNTLRWNGTGWVETSDLVITAAGVVSVTNNHSVTAGNDVADKDYVDATNATNVTDVTGGDAISATEVAGVIDIDLNVDNSTVEVNADTLRVKDAGITDAKINTVSVNKIVNGAGKYLNYQPNNTECADTELMKWDATNDRWICSGILATAVGDITDVVAGAGLTGGAASGSATVDINTDNTTVEINADTLRIKALGVDTAQLAANAVTTAKITDGNVTLAKLANGTTNGQMMFWNAAAGAWQYVSVAGIADGKILKWDAALNAGNGGWAIADDAGAAGTVVSIEGASGVVDLKNTIASGTDTGPNWSRVGTDVTLNIPLASNAATTGGGLITNAEYAAKLGTALTNTHIFVGSAGGVATDVAVSGDATIAANGALTIANNAITTAKINNANVTLAKLAAATTAGQVMEWDSGTSAWVLSKNTAPNAGEVLTWDAALNAGAGGWKAAASAGDITDVVAGAGLTGGAASGSATVDINTDNTTVEINADTLRIKALGVDTAQLAADSVTTAKIATDAVQTSDIKDANVTLAKLAAGAVKGQVMAWDSGTSAWVLSKNTAPNAGEVLTWDAALNAGVGGWKAAPTSNAVTSVEGATGAIDLINTAVSGTDAGPTWSQVGANVTLNIPMANNAATTTGGLITNAEYGRIPGAGVINRSAVYSGANTVTASAILQDDGSNLTALGTAKFYTTTLGSAGTPAYSIAGDPNTGMYSSAADTLDFATNGAQRLSISAAGIDVKSLKILNVANPAAGTDAVNRDYVDAAANGVAEVQDGTANGQLLKWNSVSAAWVPTTLTSGQFLVGNGAVPSVATAVTMSGDATMAASGAVTIANDAVTTVKILNSNVTTAKIADSNVTTAKIADANVTLAKLANGTSNGQMMFWNAGAGVWQYPNMAGLADGKILKWDTTLNAGNGGWKLDDDAGAAGTVTAIEGASGNVDLINTIASGTDTGPTWSQVGANVTLNIPLASNAATTGGGLITNAQYAAKLGTALTNTHIFVGSAGGVATDVAMSGDATIAANGALTIAADAVTTGKIATDAVQTSDIKDANVTLAKLAAGAVKGQVMAWDSGTSAWVLSKNTAPNAGEVLTWDAALNAGVGGWKAAATSNAVTSVEGATGAIDLINTAVSGTDAGPTWSQVGSNVTLNIPLASNAATTTGGLITKAQYDTFNNKLDTSLASAKIWVGNGGAPSVAAPVSMSGDATLSSAGALTIANDAITTAKINNANVTLAKLAAATTAGQVMEWDSGTSAWVLSKNTAPNAGEVLTWDAALNAGAGGWKASASAGDITDVVAGAGLTGGAASGSATVDINTDNTTVEINADTLRIKALGVDTAQLAADSVTTAKIATDAVQTSDIKDANVTLAKLVAGAVNGQFIEWDGTASAWVYSKATAPNAGEVATWDAALNGGHGGWKAAPTSNAVTSVESATGAIDLINTITSGTDTGPTWSQVGSNVTLNIPLASNAATTGGGLITNAQYAAKLGTALTNTHIFVGSAGGVATDVAMSGDATIAANGALTIAADAVTTGKIATDAVQTTDIKDANVTLAKLAAATTAGQVMAWDSGTSAWVLSKNTAPNAGEVLTWDAALNAGAGGWKAAASAGDITDVTAGAGLTGGAASGNATIDINTDNTTVEINADTLRIKALGVDTAQLAADSVTTAKIATDAVQTSDIKDANVTLAKLANGTTNGQMMFWNAAAGAWQYVSVAGIADGKILKWDITLNAGNGGWKISDDAGAAGTVASLEGATGTIDLINTITSGTDTGPNWSQAGSNVTLNIPLASNAATTGGGLITNAEYAAKLGTSLASGKMWIGNGGAPSVAAAVTMSGDATISTAGALTIANDAITTVKILDDNITTAKIATDAVQTSDIKNANVTLAKLAAATTAGQVMEWDSGTSAWVLSKNTAPNAGEVLTWDAALNAGAGGWKAAAAAGGDITDVTAGAGLTGGAASGNATVDINTDNTTVEINADTLRIKALGVDTAQLAADSVTTAKIATDAVQTSDIKDANVTLAKLVAGAVNGQFIEWDGTAGAWVYSKATAPNAGEVATWDAALNGGHGGWKAAAVSNAVTSVESATGAIDMASSVTSGTDAGPTWSQAGSVVTINIPLASNAATTTGGLITNAQYAAKLGTALTNTHIFVGSAGGAATDVAMSGDATMANTGALTIAADAITTGKIAADGVQTADIKDANVTTAKIADANVTLGKLAAATTAGQVMEWDSGTSAWVLSKNTAPNAGEVLTWDAALNAGAGGWKAAAIGGGDITDVVAGAGLTGGAASGSATVDINTDNTTVEINADTLRIKALGVDTAQLAADSVTTAKIATDAVQTSDIKDANVTLAKLVAGAVNGQFIEWDGTAGAWVYSKATAPNAGEVLTWDAALNGGHGGWKAAAATGGVTSVESATGAIDLINSITSGTDTGPTWSQAGANVTLNIPLASNAATTGGGLITNAEYAAKLGTSLASGKMWIGNGGAPSVAAAVTMSGDATISTAGALTIANDAITTVKILDDNITTAKIAADAVQTSDIKNANVTLAKLAAATTAGQVMEWDSGTSAWVLSKNTAPNAGEVLTWDAALNAGAGGWKAAAVSNAVTSVESATGAIDMASSVTSGTDAGPTWSQAGSVVTINIPLASNAATTTGGLITNAQYAAKLGTALTNTHIFVGSAGGAATDVAMSGDATMANTGALTIAADAITTGKIAADGVQTADIKDANVTLAKLAAATTAGQVMEWDSGTSAWVLSKNTAPNAGEVLTWDAALNAGAGGWKAAAAAGGDITDVTAGAGLTGGAASGNATVDINTDNTTVEINADTLRIKALGVDTAQLAADSVTTAKIATDAVQTSDIKDANVTLAKLVAGAVNGQFIEWDGTAGAWVYSKATAPNAGEVATWDAALNGGHGGWKAAAVSNAVTSVESATGAIDLINTITSGTDTGPTWSQAGSNVTLNIPLASNAATTGGGLITNAQYAAKLGTALTNTHIFVGSAGGAATDVAMSGDATMANTGALTIAADAITTGKIAADGVQTADIKDANVTLAKLAAATTAGQVMEWDSGTSAWVLSKNTAPNAGEVLTWDAALNAGAGGWKAAAAAGGDITDVTAGAGLTGGAASGNATVDINTDNTTVEINADTLRIKALGVDTAQLAADSVTTAKIATDAVQTSDIKDANVTLAKLVAGAVNGQFIEWDGTAGAWVYSKATAPNAGEVATWDAALNGGHGGWKAAPTAADAVTSVEGATGAIDMAATVASGADAGPTWTQAGAVVNINIPLASNAATTTGGLITKAQYDTFNNKLSTSLASAKIWVGDGGAPSVAAPVTMSGDATLSNTGVLTLASSSVDVTTDITGVIPLANGGTNKNMTANNGGIVWTDADSQEVLAGTATAGKMLQSGATAAPSWSTPTWPSASGTAGQILRSNGTNNLYTTATYPNTTAVNTLLYSSAADTISALATANTGALVTSNTGVPSYASGTTANRLLRTNGTTVSFAQADLTTDVTGVLPVANGGSNKNLTVANGGILWTDADSYEVTAAGTAGQVLTSGGAGTPTWTNSASANTASAIVQRDASGNFTAGTITATAFLYTSDRRLKENIQPLYAGLEQVLQLDGKSYDWKANHKHDIGLIAQEVEQVIPEAVETNTETGLKAVKYGNLIAPVIEAIKELYTMIKDLQKQVDDLRAPASAANTEMEARVNNLEKQNEDLKKEIQELKNLVLEKNVNQNKK